MRPVLALLLLTLLPATAHAASFSAPIDLGKGFAAASAFAPDGSLLVGRNNDDGKLALTRVAADGTITNAGSIKSDPDEFGVATSGPTSVVAWNDASAGAIQAAVSTNGGPFSRPRTIQRLNAASWARRVRVVATPARVVVSWTEDDNGHVFAAISDANGPFGKPQLLTSSASADPSSLASSPNGTIVAGFGAQRSGGAVYAILKPSQPRFGPAHKLGRNVDEAVASSGKTDVVLGFASGGKLNATGLQSGRSEQLASIDRGLAPSSPVFALPGAGLPVTAAWLQADEDIAVSERAPDGTWSAPRTVARGRAVGTPPLAAASARSSAVVWSRDDTYKIYGLARSDADRYGAPATLSPVTGRNPVLTAGANAIALTWADRHNHTFLAVLRDPTA